MKPNRFRRTRRRDFLKNAAFLGAAAVVAGTRAGRTVAAGPNPPPKTGAGYRTTAHIRRYYERAALI